MVAPNRFHRSPVSSWRDRQSHAAPSHRRCDPHVRTDRPEQMNHRWKNRRHRARHSPHAEQSDSRSHSRNGDDDSSTNNSNSSIPVRLSFGNFETQEMRSVGQRGGGVRELASLLRQARRRVSAHRVMLTSAEGVAQRNAELLSTAAQRASGMKIKDDAARLSKSLMKRRNKKRQSAKRWSQRLQSLQDSVDSVVKDRGAKRQAMRASKDAKKRAKSGQGNTGTHNNNNNSSGHHSKSFGRGKGESEHSSQRGGGRGGKTSKMSKKSHSGGRGMKRSKRG